MAEMNTLQMIKIVLKFDGGILMNGPDHAVIMCYKLFGHS